jgi:hypothetical protein
MEHSWGFDQELPSLEHTDHNKVTAPDLELVEAVSHTMSQALHLDQEGFARKDCRDSDS